MLSIRLSSVLYPTQLHGRAVCTRVRGPAPGSIDMIISTYTSSLMVCTRPVREPPRVGMRMRLSGSHTRLLGVFAASLAREPA